MDITKISGVTKTRVPWISAAVSWIPQRYPVLQRQEYHGYLQLFNGSHRDIQCYKDKRTLDIYSCLMDHTEISSVTKTRVRRITDNRDIADLEWLLQRLS